MDQKCLTSAEIPQKDRNAVIRKESAKSQDHVSCQDMAGGAGFRPKCGG